MMQGSIDPGTRAFTLAVPARQPLFSTRGWLALALVALLAAVVVPVCALVLPDTHPLYLSAYALTLIGKIMC
ncbi:hypothetical protein O6467_25640, partial [Salmonella enterica subsp. enterica]